MSELERHTRLSAPARGKWQTRRTVQERQSWRWILPVAGLLSVIWVLVRVVPKPARAAYPCQRVAMPLAASFVVWLAGGLGIVALARKVQALLRGARIDRVLGSLGLAALAAAIMIFHIPPRISSASSGLPPNAPMGVARGIHPGRVVWVHDPTATDWEGTDDDGNDIGDGYWWQSEHTDQDVVDNMFSRAVRALAGEGTTTDAWDAIFRHFNIEHGKGDVGYQPGEKITVKVNLITTQPSVNWSTGEQTGMLGFVNTSPQMILALLRQLVYVANVDQADITVGDPLDWFPNHYWDHCHTEFPDVHYVQALARWGRYGVVSSEGTPYETRIHWSTSDADGKIPDYLPVSYAEAAYMINFACLKGHGSGITLCAKNHYGSLGYRQPPAAGYYDLHASLARSNPGMGHYRAHVDITGHSHLGGKTVLYLIDGLYAGYYWEGHPYKWALPPFGDGQGGTDWPSSLFASLDPVAIDSVAYDFLLSEWPDVVTGGGGTPGCMAGGEEDYLHEGALANDPPSGTFYDPDGSRMGLSSLGVHEHWDNSLDKQYTRNLGTGDGIELLAVNAPHDGDFDHDGAVSLGDFITHIDCLAGPATSPAPTDPVTPAECLATFDFDFDTDVDTVDYAAFQPTFTGQ